jgi:pantoate--beta-alanine ligase
MLHLQGKMIGFVPTMGYLHKGHTALIYHSQKVSDVTVVSIFVNPIQFGPNEDFSKYPRDLKRDINILEDMKVDYLFLPSRVEIYPDDFQTYVNVEKITQILEGKSRPSHFRGVTTIVSILFNIIYPGIVIFGQKDAQQVFIIEKMVKDLKMPVKILVKPIVREKDGLALSSRNVYLSEYERKDALVLNNSLKKAKKLISDGEREVSIILSTMKRIINGAESAEIDYISVVDYSTFLSVREIIKGKKYYILIACRIGKTRLIDNILINA